MELSPSDQKLFDVALDVVTETARSNDEDHRAFCEIIAGLCAIISKLLAQRH